MNGIDLAAEMAAARQRRTEQTARALRDARVLAVRAAARPGATRVDVEEMAHSFYPRLNAEQLEEVVSMVWDNKRSGSPTPVAPKPEDDVDDEHVDEMMLVVADEEEEAAPPEE